MRGNGQWAVGNGGKECVGEQMVKIESYRDLEVWQQGIQIAKECYMLTKAFPKEEMFGLTSQIRRAAASIPANIAEGYGRDNTGDYVHFLRIAQGSLKELETHLILSREVGILAADQCELLLAKADRLGRMLFSLIKKLQMLRNT
jgi:four helix bundle protein